MLFGLFLIVFITFIKVNTIMLSSLNILVSNSSEIII